MRRSVFARFVSWLLTLVFIFSMVSPTIQASAASKMDITIQSTDDHYSLSFSVIKQPAKVQITWHDPNGNEIVLSYEAGKFSYDERKERVTVSGLSFAADHIYDITVAALDENGSAFATESLYYLADMTFTGQSFNIMTDGTNNIDTARIREGQSIVSGRNPKIELTWNVPTVYANGTVKTINEWLDEGRLTSIFGSQIDEIQFHVDMNEGRGSSDIYSCAVIYKSGSSLGWSGSGDAPSMTYSKDEDIMTLTLESKNGIESGTEYEKTRIRFDFKSNSASDAIALDRIGLKTARSSFLVENEDIDRLDIDFPYETSIYTPIEFSIKKVDEDLILVEFGKLKNGNYPELYYQIQYSTDQNQIYKETSLWPKIKWVDPFSDDVRELIQYDPDEKGIYIAVALYPNKDSNSPFGASLNLKSNFVEEITTDTLPPLPKDIQAAAGNSRNEKMKVADTGGEESELKILLSDLDISFEAPEAWKELRDQGKWEDFRNAPYSESSDMEYTFHILLSCYRPDADVDEEKEKIGQEDTAEIYLPVKQKRVLVIGKKNLTWDPEHPNRLVVDFSADPDPDSKARQLIPGNKLFWDYTTGQSIAQENNEDHNEDGKGDYPDFLVPNTIYYMQIFTSRYKDNASINAAVWADGLPDNVGAKLSYVSSVVSFTTPPYDKKPVPVPNIRSINEELETDSDNEITLKGITVTLDRLLTRTDWQRYTSKEEKRTLEYEIYMSQNPNFANAYKQIETVHYDDKDAEKDPVSVFIDSAKANIKPNTTYYFKVRAVLYAPDEKTGEVEMIARSDYSPIRTFTTPKIAPKDVDDTERRPSAPTDFAIAKDQDGEDRVTDTQAVVTWRHKESDVVYELICTMDGNTEDYANDAYNLEFIKKYKNLASGNAVVIDPADPKGILKELGFSMDENNQILLPIGEGFFKPNTIYYFSLRAVRKDGKGEPSVWVTLPVTTSMVKAPEYFEAVRDLEVGFQVECTISGSDADSMEVYMKKSGQSDNAYTKLLRSQYTVVKDRNTYYFRVYNLESDTVYHFRLYNKAGKEWYVFDENGGYWCDKAGEPIPAKTRDTFHEIEVRWVGEDLYDYFLELRSEQETAYEELTELVHYGYDLPSGNRIALYREKSSAIVKEGSSNKYVYYALISRRPVDGDSSEGKALKTNTLYYVRLWAQNKADQGRSVSAGESLHVGPVKIRTDFSQDDYDKDKERDNVEDIYNREADQLLQKLYWLVDSRSATKVRALLKGDMVSGLLQASPGMTVTIDFSGELDNAASYEILVPQKVLETMESNDSRLNLKLSGAELTLNRGSVDMSGLKLQALSGGAKEAMLCLRIERKSKSDEAFPKDTKRVSNIYDLSVSAVGSKRTYDELNAMIDKILNDPDATGPFKYGIFDREMSKVLAQLDRYSYRSHTELKDMIRTVMEDIEAELSRYLKDILDGGSGLTASIAINKPVNSLPGRVGFKIEYQVESGLIAPYVNYHASKGWNELSSAAGYVLQYILFRADAPGEYAILVKSSISVSPGSPYEETISKLGSRYDLKKVFGNAAIYPGDPMTGQQAVLLYAVLTGRDSELTGLTPNQKVSVLGLGDILGVKELTGYVDNQSALSLAVRLYCAKLGISSSMLQPAGTIVISNAAQVSSRLYHDVVVGIDLGFASLKNNQFDAAGRSTLGQVLDMVLKVLKKVGEL